ncbi:MAG: hypothetical protein ACI9NT_002395 [Bacteroidia bacterium]|jgi:hypothetical protein
MKRHHLYAGSGLLGAIICLGTTAMAQDDTELAKKLSNPVAALISVPIQANYDTDIGVDDGSVWRTNIQPVIPISIGEEWNLISRTILPVIDQTDIPVNGSGESGIGDVVQSLFFSPKAPSASGLIWGVGPALLLKTATDDALGSEKWGAGPTGVALNQVGPWTYGLLANHIESFAGDSKRADVSATFLQPFLSYITQTKTTIGINTESTYDWESEQWSVPVNFTVNQLLKVADQLVQVGGGARYWVDAPDNGPDGWGLRLQLTFLFPK